MHCSSILIASLPGSLLVFSAVIRSHLHAGRDTLLSLLWLMQMARSLRTRCSFLSPEMSTSHVLGLPLSNMQCFSGPVIVRHTQPDCWVITCAADCRRPSASRGFHGLASMVIAGEHINQSLHSPYCVAGPILQNHRE